MNKSVIRRRVESPVRVEIILEKKKGFLPFEELDIWIRAREMVKYVYTVTKPMTDRSFRDQLQRAAISVMNNIAEGREAGSAKLFRRYLGIAKASCGEVRSMFYAAQDLGFTTPIKSMEAIDRATQLSKMIAGFTKTLK